MMRILELKGWLGVRDATLNIKLSSREVSVLISGSQNIVCIRAGEIEPLDSVVRRAMVRYDESVDPAVERYST